MDVKKELLSDITASLDLLAKYSDLDKKEIQSLISSVVNGTKNKNLIDLFVMREFIKDKTSSILAADIDQDRAQMQEATDGVDFGTDDMGGNAPEGAVSKEEKEDFENRKQELLDKAEGYLESIDLGINNIENGDVNLELVGQLIDLKSLIQDSLDAVNEADSAEENDDKKLNILEAVLNNLEPNGEDGDTSLEDIIKNVSGGAVDADTEISTLIKKLNDIVENPEEYLSKSSEDSEFGDETPEDFDAVVFPGGNGSAKNLFTYAIEGANCTVREDTAAIIRAFHNAGKPIGALCIAPVMIAKVLGDVTVTVGSDPGTVRNVESFGTKHEITIQKGVCADTANKVFTTPCYMLPARISDIADCADNLVKAMMSVMQEK